MGILSPKFAILAIRIASSSNASNSPIFCYNAIPVFFSGWGENLHLRVKLLILKLVRDVIIHDCVRYRG